MPRPKDDSRLTKFFRLLGVIFITALAYSFLVKVSGLRPDVVFAAVLLGWFIILLGAFIIVTIFAISGLSKRDRKLKLRKLSDISTIFNIRKQFLEHLECMQETLKTFGLQSRLSYRSMAALTSNHVISRRPVIELASGEINGRGFSVSSVLIGDDFLTRIQARANFNIPLEAWTSDDDVAMLGVKLGVLTQVKPKIITQKLTLRFPDKDMPDEFIGKYRDILKDLEELLNLKPSTLNLSQQAAEFYCKKISVEKDKAYLDDFGLVRDEQYFIELIKGFLQFISAWEKV